MLTPLPDQVFKRWDQALADEALMVKDVGKPEFSARCQSIAEDILPVEQNVLNAVRDENDFKMIVIL